VFHTRLHRWVWGSTRCGGDLSKIVESKVYFIQSPWALLELCFCVELFKIMTAHIARHRPYSKLCSKLLLVLQRSCKQVSCNPRLYLVFSCPRLYLPLSLHPFFLVFAAGRHCEYAKLCVCSAWPRLQPDRHGARSYPCSSKLVASYGTQRCY